MILDGRKALENVLEDMGQFIAERLIAKTTIWIHPEIYQIIRSETNPTACFFKNSRRAKRDEKVRTRTADGIFLDSNECAIQTMKQCTGDRAVPHSYTTCHIHKSTTYDTLYHTCVANIVWVPAAIASLTDGEHKNVGDMLKRQAYELYDGFYIGEVPPKPVFWDNIDWQDVREPTKAVIRRVKNKFNKPK